MDLNYLHFLVGCVYLNWEKWPCHFSQMEKDFGSRANAEYQFDIPVRCECRVNSARARARRPGGRRRGCSGRHAGREGRVFAVPQHARALGAEPRGRTTNRDKLHIWRDGSDNHGNPSGTAYRVIIERAESMRCRLTE
ncbi:hypothetical protein [Burkholderia stagnalis]